jgi:cytochrome c peroxidase
MYAPIRYFDKVEGLWIGGQFWDSRATGEVLGDPLADQALGPFLNPVEMANPNKTAVVRDALDSEYGDLFIKECIDVDLSIEDQVNAAYDCIALSIAAFERTALFAPFSSKYDAYLKACLEEGGDKDDCAIGVGPETKMVVKKIFSRLEWKGFQLFMGENDNNGILEPGEGAMCAACHVAGWTVDPGNVVVPDWSPDGSIPPLITDFTYDNLGVPKSKHRLLRKNDVDLGLGPIVGDPDENGKFKVMTLRNIGKTKPYTHNGFFHSLWGITHFYNTRDVKKWRVPEVPETVNTDELGNLGLRIMDEIAIVRFMRTLSDGYIP